MCFYATFVIQSWVITYGIIKLVISICNARKWLVQISNWWTLDAKLEDTTIIADGMLQFRSVTKFPSDWNTFLLIFVHANNAINETIETIYGYGFTSHRLSLIIVVLVVALNSVECNRDTIVLEMVFSRIGYRFCAVVLSSHGSWRVVDGRNYC